MATITPDNQIAANHNNAAGLQRWDAVTDANGVKFLMPKNWPYRSRGQRRFRLNGTTGFLGLDATRLLFGAMTLSQYAYILSTYEGLVTVRIPFTSTSYTNYNAVLTMPDENDLEFVYFNGSMYTNNWTGPGYINVIATISSLEAL
jgi:hypothetical protein